MTNLPTTRQLQYLIALHEQQHFGKAAEQCFISQSAFSIAIKELENTLDCQLFERTNRRVRTTRAGVEVVTRAQSVLLELDNLVNCAQSGKDPFSGELKLGVIPTIAPFLLPRLIPKLQRIHPQLELVLREEQTAKAYASLMDGKLDVILIALPYELPNCSVEELFDDPFHLAFRSNSRWLSTATKYAQQAPDRLPDEAVILLEDGHCLRDHALSQCELQSDGQQKQLSPYSSTSITTLLHMVAQDMGVTYVPDMAIGSPLLKGLRIKTLAMPENSLRGVGLAWRKGSVFSDSYKLFAQEIRDIYEA